MVKQETQSQLFFFCPETLGFFSYLLTNFRLCLFSFGDHNTIFFPTCKEKGQPQGMIVQLG